MSTDIQVKEAWWLFWADGFTPCATRVYVKPGWSQRKSLVEHEKKHCAQMQRDGTAVFWWRYWSSRSWRKQYEGEAYAVSVYYGQELAWTAQYLASHYWLGISAEEARTFILDELAKLKISSSQTR